jgi:hypothetical protein
VVNGANTPHLVGVGLFTPPYRLLRRRDGTLRVWLGPVVPFLALL